VARTKNFDENKALEEAMLLFWQNGYEATSMQQLESAMGLKRTSIYNAFGHKRALYRLSLNHYQQNVLINFQHALNQAKTARDAIRGSLKEAIKLNFTEIYPGGCLVMLSLLESHQHDKETKDLLDQTLQQLTKSIAQRIKQAIISGELDKNTPYQEIAEQVTALISGISVMAKANYSKKVLQRLVDFSVDALLPSA
jgi:TetR/AcrR family transcriptional repressor of nem operon